MNMVESKEFRKAGDTDVHTIGHVYEAVRKLNLHFQKCDKQLAKDVGSIVNYCRN